MVYRFLRTDGSIMINALLTAIIAVPGFRSFL